MNRNIWAQQFNYIISITYNSLKQVYLLQISSKPSKEANRLA